MTLQDERVAAPDLAHGSPRVTVIVGSDHHPFDRLISWVGRWLSEHPEQRDSFFVQFGAASKALPCRSARLLQHDALQDLLQQSDVVVCHGGPGAALDCWKRGIRPIVVPRLRRYGEVVDDHQVDFCRAQHEAGRVVMAESYEELRALLERATADRTAFYSDTCNGNVSLTVARFAELVEELVHPQHPGGRRIRRIWQRRHADAASATPSEMKRFSTTTNVIEARHAAGIRKEQQ